MRNVGQQRTGRRRPMLSARKGGEEETKEEEKTTITITIEKKRKGKRKEKKVGKSWRNRITRGEKTRRRLWWKLLV